MLALAVVVLAGLYLVGLGVAAFVTPTQAARFLMSFARTAFTHYLELGIRLLVGGAFLLHSRQMASATAFALFGWVLIGTTTALFLVPWRWHRRFAERSVSRAVRYIRLIGAASLAFGTLILWVSIRDAV